MLKALSFALTSAVIRVLWNTFAVIRNGSLTEEFDVPVTVHCVNLLKPTGYVMHHHQFSIQQLYALPTLYLCVLYLSENKQRLVPLTA